MTAPQVLARLAAAGIRLTVDGARLLASPAGALTDQHRDLIRSNKPLLHAYLSKPRRDWSVVEATGTTWRSCVSPPMTMAELLAAYPSGTRAVPVEDPDQGQPLPPDIEAAVTAWLDSINETDQQTRAEALELARNRRSVRARYLEEPKLPGPGQGAQDNGESRT